MLNENVCISCFGDIKEFGEYIYSTESSYFRKVLRDKILYLCSKCGLIQANHSIIIPEKLDNYYKNVYLRNKSEIPSNSKSFWKWKGRGIVFCWIINDYVKNNEKPLYIYELGSGDGLNLTELKIAFPNARIFSDPFNSDKFNQEIKREELKERKYDIVLLSHVLEHLLDPIKWIINISNSLKKKGLLIIEVPNDNEYFINRSYLERNNRNDEPHITFFNSQSLIKIFEPFSNELIIKDLYTSGNVYRKRKSFPAEKSIKQYIKKVPILLNQFNFNFHSRKLKKHTQVSNDDFEIMNTIDKTDNSLKSNYNTYSNKKLIPWFTNYLLSISRKIESNPNPQKEGELLRIILQKIV